MYVISPYRCAALAQISSVTLYRLGARRSSPIMGRRKAGSSCGGGGGRGSGKRGAAALTAANLSRHAVAAAAAAAAADRGDDDDDGQAQRAPSKRAKAGPATCLACQQVPGETAGGRVGNYSDRCKACFETFMEGFTIHGEWHEFCAKMDENDEVRADFDEAKQVKADPSRATFFPQEVTVGDDVMVDVQQVLIGPSRAQLIEALGCTPEECGAKLQDLPDLHGNRFKGLLLQDPSAPYLRYTVTNRFRVGKNEYSMPSSKQLYARQASESYEFVKQDKMMKDSGPMQTIMTKMRTMPWTTDALLQKATQRLADKGKGPPPGWPMAPGVAADGQPSQPPAGKSPSEHGGTPNDDASADGSVVGSMPPPPPSFRGPVLNSRLQELEPTGAPGSTRGRGSKQGGTESECGSRTFGISPGAKPSRIKVGDDGLPVSDNDRRELVDRRISSASLWQILSGVAMGREVGWAKSTRDLFSDAGELSFAGELDKHLALCKHAEELVAEPIMKMRAASLELRVKELHDAGVDLPSNVKLMLLKRHIAQLQSEVKAGSTSEWLSAVVPWSCNGPAEGAVAFDGLEPRLAALKCSPQERGQLFSDGVRDVLLCFIKKGASGVEDLLAIAEELIAFLDQHTDDEAAEAYDEYVSDLLVAARALLCLGDPKCTKHFDAVAAVDEVGGKKTKEAKQTVKYAVFVALKGDEHWWALRDEFSKHGHHTKALRPRMAKLSAMLADSGSSVDPGQLQEVLDCLPDFVDKCRSGACEDLEHEADKALKAFCASSNLQAIDYSAAGIGARLRELQALLKQATLSLPASGTYWAEQLALVQQAAKEVATRSSLSAFGDVVRSLSAHSFSDPGEFKKLQVVFTEMLAATCQATPSLTQDLTAFAELSLKHVMSECSSPKQAEPLLDMLRELKGSALIGELVGAEWARTLASLEAWQPLSDAMGELANLGASASERASSTKCDGLARSFATHRKTFASCPGVAQAPPHLSQFMDQVDAFWMELRDARVALDKAALLKACRPIGCLAKGAPDGKSWRAAIPEGKDNDQELVVKVAREQLDTMDGPQFAHDLESLQSARLAYANTLQMFEAGPSADADYAQVLEVITDATVTKTIAVMLHHGSENEKNPNPGKLRRAIKKLKADISEPHLQERVHPMIAEWIEAASSFTSQG